ncbi:MAG: aspartate aminotransferase family protein [Bacteroidetes bacterium]|nr:aspartate aminotransferase family protein [Bacteroidota bacterium]
MHLREDFFRHVAQTSPSPLALEFVKAEGSVLIDRSGKRYIDLISGIAVSNLGHGNKQIIDAIKNQADAYLHLMVYGEYIESPQVLLATKLASLLPPSLSSSYFVNSGAEAVEGAIKLARRYTGRSELISFYNAYHGSSTGALSIGGNEELKNAFRPLMPGVLNIRYNSIDDIQLISNETAAVFVEPIQGEAGIILPEPGFLSALRARCTETGTLLVYDEIQTGMGRTGKLFCFEHEKIVPDVLLLSKAFGGGMPLGVFISGTEIMSALTVNPVLGHITTFGGHPVSCAASLAALQQLTESSLIVRASEKEKIFRRKLQHPLIKDIRGKGLFLSLQFPTEEINKKVIHHCILNGVLADWFLFAPDCLRIAPPLIITEQEIENCCDVILDSLNQI